MTRTILDPGTRVRTILDPGTRDSDGRGRFGDTFNCPEALNGHFAVGQAPKGGRHETGGMFDPEPFCFVYGCATVLTAEGDGMAEFRTAPTVHVGDTVEIKGYGLRRVEFYKSGTFVDRYNLQLVELPEVGCYICGSVEHSTPTAMERGLASTTFPKGSCK